MKRPLSLCQYRTGRWLALPACMFALHATLAIAQPPSSGTASGTGTGASGGTLNATGSGVEGGTSGATTGGGTESGGTGALPSRILGDVPGPSQNGRLLNPPPLPGSYSIPAGPGAITTFPGEEGMIPLDAVVSGGLPRNAAEYTNISDIHFNYALQIPEASDRSLALSRIASAATFSDQPDMAERALIAAAEAALQIPAGLVRDQRLLSIVAELRSLAETRVRDGTETSAMLDPFEEEVSALPKLDRVALIRKAQADWKKARELCEKVANPTYRNEMLYRVSDSMGGGSQSIVNEFPHQAGMGAHEHASGFEKSYDGLADDILQNAAALAATIDRPVWRDRAMVSIAWAAAQSRQFARALDIARMIPQPEVRTDALLKIAENQARLNDPKGATATYQEAANAVASIPLEDPRAVLAGVLIDNLISVGRFDDARASVRLYPDEPRRITALEVIAESMGRRGVSQSALAWINKEAPAAYRSRLYRHVSNGIISAIEQNRSRDLSIPAR